MNTHRPTDDIGYSRRGWAIAVLVMILTILGGPMLTGPANTQVANASTSETVSAPEVPIAQIENDIEVPAPEPAPEPAPTPETVSAPQPALLETWTVQPGDTLTRIAVHLGTTVDRIWELNRDIVPDKNLIYPGQVLRLVSSPQPPPAPPAAAEVANVVAETPAPEPAPEPAPAPAANASGWAHPFPELTRCTSGVGPRWGTVHQGVDMANGHEGSPVLAAAGGTIAKIGPSDGYGYAVFIDHGNGIFGEYGHVIRGSYNHLSVGQQVTAGQQIAQVGNEGQSTGPHLHFELTYGQHGEYLDPEPFLAERGIVLCPAH